MDFQSKKEVMKMQEQTEHLECKLSSLQSDLQSAQQLNTSLSFELQNTAREENYESMEISELMVINKHLKDKNDELVMQLQSLTEAEEDGYDDQATYNAIGEAFRKPISDFMSTSQHESLKQECKCSRIFTGLLLAVNFSASSLTRNVPRWFH